MKEEAMKVHADAVLAADGVLYDAGFADGEISGKAAGGGFTQADLDAAKKAGFDEAVAADTTPITLAERDELKAHLDQAVADGAINADLVVKMKSLLGLNQPAPAPEVPVEETKGTDAQP